ncbi:MAG: hypothetical protein OEW58_12315 [Gammaproteobacteria bacterium]|nr:hypothetical protein [Gammaproteobacteria bacterium]
MTHLQNLLNEINELQERVSEEISREAEKLGYSVHNGRVQFEEQIKHRHHQMAMSLRSYLATSRWLVIFTAPIVYSLLLPMLLLDLGVSIYQRLCFPLYRIPRVTRRDYFIYDRQQLKYLNLIERIHFSYCSYGNGLLGYATEIAARTEQYWCPIKHAKRNKTPHSRYYHFLSYGDAEDYENKLQALRKKFDDC